MRVADYIIEKTAQAGAEYIFLVTGRGILYLTDAVAKSKNIEGISMLHEQSASYAAMSYARARNGIGACLVSTGCAAANAVTGALCAYQDSIPVVFISGQHMLHETTRFTGVPIRTYGSQEADIVRIVEPVTKYAVMLTDANRVVYEMEKAIYMAQTGRPGPVWIDIPLDIQSLQIEPEELEHFQPEENQDYSEYLGMYTQITADELETAQRPLLFVGGGAAGCRQEVRELAEKLCIPVVFSYSGCDIYGSGNTYAIGTVNSLGSPRAGNFAFQNSDFILVLGSKLCSQTIGNRPEMIARAARIIVVDIDPAEHKKGSIRIDHYVNADIKEFLGELSKRKLRKCPDDWLQKCFHWKKLFHIDTEEFIRQDQPNAPVDLYDFCSKLGTELSSETAVITDAGLEELIVPSTIPFRERQKCLFPASQGAMGYAVPAILGAHFAGCKDIVAVIGDGSIMMNIQELQLLEYHHVKARIFVINNGLYAVIRSRQKDLFRTRTIGNDSTDGVPSPDFKKLAEAFGVTYFHISGTDGLKETLQEVLAFDGSCLCEVMCRHDQKYFHTSFRKNERGKLVRPPIEDESPFLERKVFLSEMIVDPVEI